jgi:uncharacterized protein (TIGR00251 family)
VIVSTAGGVVIDVRVIPRASKAGLAGSRDGALLVRLNAPPVEGAANDELIELIAKALGVPRRSVTIVAGERARLKRVQVRGVGSADAARALGLADAEGLRRG